MNNYNGFDSNPIVYPLDTGRTLNVWKEVMSKYQHLEMLYFFNSSFSNQLYIGSILYEGIVPGTAPLVVSPKTLDFYFSVCLLLYKLFLPRGGAGRHLQYCNAGPNHGKSEASFGNKPPFKNPINTYAPYRCNPGVNLDRTATTL